MKINIYANCMLSKGINRSIIIDTQRMSYSLIPNDMFNILMECEGMTIKSIKEKYNSQFDNIIDEYFDFLIDNEFVFINDKPELFPKIENNFLIPFKITNAIIEFDKSNFNDLKFEEILHQIDDLKCKSIEIRIINLTNLDFVNKILDYLSKINSIINHIEFYIHTTVIFEVEDILPLFENLRISFVILYNENYFYNLKDISENRFLLFSNERYSGKINCGIVDRKYFVTNLNAYLESINHNSCLHKKISIDKDGYIRNCPSMPQHFGNIKDTTLEEALNHPDFKKYWNVTKDMIEICKDCEFRHICTDCRAYTERTHFEEEIDLSKPLKCGYNPYTNEWAEWSTNPLKQKAIEYYGMQELVKKDA